MSDRRVVITGMGIVSPVGSTIADAWRNVCEGNSGTVAIDSFDTSTFPTRIAGLVKGFDVDNYLAKKDQRKNDPFIWYGVGAAIDAIRDSGLEINEDNGHAIGVAMGSGVGGLHTIAENHNKLLNGGVRKISPFFIPASIINMTSGQVSIFEKITGPNISVVTACATSTHCIGLAARSIEHGDADVMLAGGSEYATTPLAMAGFCSARAMTTRNDDPKGASRPYDVDRDGFVFSDGAGCVVLEELQHAKKRGGTDLRGTDRLRHERRCVPYYLTARRRRGCPQMHDGGNSRCRYRPVDEIDYVNTHGTSTPAGDIGETNGIKRGLRRSCLQDHDQFDQVHHRSPAWRCRRRRSDFSCARDQGRCRSADDQPATTRIRQCDLDYTPNNARDASVRTVLSNSFGFGGTNGSLILRAFD